MGGQGGDVLPEQLDPAPLGREEAEYRLEESALAHAVLAKQGKDFAGPDAERDIAQYHGFAVPAAQIGNVEDGWAHGASS
jgi:hypothetical protein